MLPGSRETNDKDEVPSTAACAKPRAAPVSSAASARPASPTTLDPSAPPPAGPLHSPAAIAEVAETEAAEVDAVLDAWARGPPTPPAMGELRREIKRARSTSDAKDSPPP